MVKIDERPPIWIGHVSMPVTDVKQSAVFMCSLGIREILHSPNIVIFELRGGTPLLLQSVSQPILFATAAPFDLDASHAKCEGLELSPSTIQDDMLHRSFTLCDPSVHIITVNDSHVSGLPVQTSLVLVAFDLVIWATSPFNTREYDVKRESVFRKIEKNLVAAKTYRLHRKD